MAGRVHIGLRNLLNPGGVIAWFDHHPASVLHADALRSVLSFSPRSWIIDRSESVSLVAEAFGMERDPVMADPVMAARAGWDCQVGPSPLGP